MNIIETVLRNQNLKKNTFYYYSVIKLEYNFELISTSILIL